MKATRLIFAALLVSSPAGPSLADPAQPPTSQGVGPLLAFCRDVVLPNLPGANLGECVSYGNAFQTPENSAAFAAHECDVLLETGELDNMGISYADCIHMLS